MDGISFISTLFDNVFFIGQIIPTPLSMEFKHFPILKMHPKTGGKGNLPHTT